jgi:hypothetical protein
MIAIQNVLRFLDRRLLQLDPVWCGSHGLEFAEIECRLVQEAWMRDAGMLKLRLSFGVYQIPMVAVLDKDIAIALVRERPCR